MSPGLREKKQAQIRAAIFRAALALFEEKGFDAASVDEIADRAQVSRATYFNYFGTKEGVLRYYGEQLAAHLAASAGAAGRGRGPLEIMRGVLEAWASYTAAHRDEAATVYRYSLRGPDCPLRLTSARQGVLELFERLAGAGQAAGQIRSDLPAGHVALFVLSVFQSALGLYVAGDGVPLESSLEMAWTFITGGIGHAGRQA